MKKMSDYNLLVLYNNKVVTQLVKYGQYCSTLVIVTFSVALEILENQKEYGCDTRTIYLSVPLPSTFTPPLSNLGIWLITRHHKTNTHIY